MLFRSNSCVGHRCYFLQPTAASNPASVLRLLLLLCSRTSAGILACSSCGWSPSSVQERSHQPASPDSEVHCPLPVGFSPASQLPVAALVNADAFRDIPCWCTAAGSRLSTCCCLGQCPCCYPVQVAPWCSFSSAAFDQDSPPPVQLGSAGVSARVVFACSVEPAAVSPAGAAADRVALVSSCELICHRLFWLIS